MTSRDVSSVAVCVLFRYCVGPNHCPNKMGYTVRVHAYRYTVWVGFNKCANSSCPAALADWDT